MTAVRRRAATVLVLAQALVPATARADYKDDYKKGLEALAKRRLGEAAGFFQQAALGQTREGERVRLYGVRLDIYLPHFHLGLALAQLGDCEGALRAWKVSESQGAIQKAEQYATLEKEREACRVKLAEAKPKGPSPEAKPPAGPDPMIVARAVVSAELEVERARGAAQGVARLASEPGLASSWSSEEALGPAQKRAAELLASAQAQLEAGRKSSDLARLAEAREQAARASQQLERVRQLAEQRQAELRQAELRRAADLPKPATPSAVPPPVGDVRPAAAPPADLVRAAQSFFQGRYETALERLDALRLSSGRGAAQVRLLRAAARYAMFLKGSQKDDALLRAAAEDVKACRRLDPTLFPDAEAFSPSFRGFFEKGS